MGLGVFGAFHVTVDGDPKAGLVDGVQIAIEACRLDIHGLGVEKK